MGEQYMGEIRIASFGFAPNGWMLCNGQILPIAQYQALYSLLGTTYGGNGSTTFALPNLQSRVPLHWGQGFVQGQVGGEASHVLNTNEIPTHTHQATAQSVTGTDGRSPAGALPSTGPEDMYATTMNATMATSPAGVAGSSQPHENQAPYLVVNMMIAVQGLYPSRP